MKLKLQCLIFILCSIQSLFAQTPNPGDLVLTEMHYATHQSGYVEFYNKTNNYYSFEAELNGIDIGQITILPNSFLLLGNTSHVTTSSGVTLNWPNCGASILCQAFEYLDYLELTDEYGNVLSGGRYFDHSSYGRSLYLNQLYSVDAPDGVWQGSSFYTKTTSGSSPMAFGNTNSTRTEVNFDAGSLVVQENTRQFTINIDISNPSPSNAVNLDLRLAEGDISNTGLSEIKSITIPANSSTHSETISFFDNDYENQDRDYLIVIENIDGGYSAIPGNDDQLLITITDDDTDIVTFNQGWLSPTGTQQGIFIDSVTSKVGIGTAVLPGDFNLFVRDGIRTEKLRVDVANDNGWADYVFGDDYNLMSIDELEKFIIKNRHLPEVPSTAEVTEEGVDVAQIDALLLKKIEELTLYIIQLKKSEREKEERIEALEKEMRSKK